MRYRLFSDSFLIVCSFIFFIGCANRGVGPQGGPRDSIPPTIVRETPMNKSINYKKRDVEIVFNEYIKLDNVQTNVFISPPSAKTPEIQTIGKKVVVHFLDDSLQNNTTYTINFGDAICDNNEKNALKNYSLCFSTGDTIDSLAIYGQLVYASDLNPVSDIVVGIHDDISDTVIASKPFLRIGKTDEFGMFAISNIRPGKYKIYALNDVSKDFMYQPGEQVAFLDSILIPSIRPIEKRDTIYKTTIVDDSLKKEVDTIRKRTEMLREPAEIMLYLFYEDFSNLYFRRAVRNNRHNFQLFFSSKQPSQLPILRPIQPNEADTSLAPDPFWLDWTQHLLIQPSITGDTITYWITDSAAMKDTLFAELTYAYTDSNKQITQRTDTIALTYKPPKLSNRAQAKMKKRDEQRKIKISSNGKEHFEVYDTLTIFFDAPIKHWEKDSTHFFTKKDTITKDVPFSIVPIDEAQMRFHILADIKPGETYYLAVDSGGITDIYNHPNDKYKTDLKLRSIEEYATLNVLLTHFQQGMRLQLLDDKERVVRDIACTDGDNKMIHLLPKSYYLRLYIDSNGDGKYTTGNLKKRQQPETVFYFPAKLTLRANWDFEEHFDHLAVPQLRSKPIAIVKDIKKDLDKANK